MSATIILLPGVQRKEEAPAQAAPYIPPDRREAVFRCLVALTEAETYQDPVRFLDMLWAQGFMIVRTMDGHPLPGDAHG